MIEWSDEQLAGYLDGELERADHAALEMAVTRDAAVAARLARLRGLRERLRAAYNPVLQEPIPERLLEALNADRARPAAEPIDLAQVRAQRLLRAQRAARRPASARWSTMAAAILVGICAALLWQHLPSRAGNVAYSGGHMMARGALAAALDQQLAAETTSGSVRIGLSFRSSLGGYCRTFVINAAQAQAGLACRDQADWRIVNLVEVAPAADSAPAYRMAGSALPPAILQSMNERMSGEALDAQAERAARDQGWR